MADLQQLEKALVNADKAGDMDAARKLAAAIRQLKNPEPDVSAQETTAKGLAGAVTRGLALPVAGAMAGGAAGALLGGVGAVPGAIVGAGAASLAGLVGDPVVNAVNKLFGSSFQSPTEAIEGLLTKAGVAQPQTSVEKVAQAVASGAGGAGGMATAGKGLQMAASGPVAKEVGRMMAAQPVAQVLGGAGAGGAGQAVREGGGGTAAEIAASLAGGVAGGMAGLIGGTRKGLAEQILSGQPIREMMPGATAKKPTPGTQASGGAAGVDMATLRQAKANELPVPIKLTEGQKTRQFEQQRFERETAKLPEVGEPIRERFATQNKQLQQNLETFIDMTGSEAPDLRSIGLIVDKALRDRAARDKTRIRTLYKEAEKAGEMEAPVKLDSVVQHLVDNVPEAEVANVLKATRAKALQLGVATEAPDGALIAQPVSLKTAELFRRSIAGATNAEPTNIMQASQMRSLIDASTEGLGGDMYKQARAARSRFANDYDNIGLVKNLLGQKRGSNDRSIAMEDVLRRSVIDPSTSLDTVRQVRRLLQTEGPNGQQAWKELQGGTLKFMRDEATKSVGRDELGNAILSPAQLDRVVSQLDKSGKLDFIFGKKGAEQLRIINDVAKDVLVAPPGAVNTSNTASVLAGMMDIAISGTAGVPAPVMTSFRLLTKGVKDAKTRARVKQALSE